MSLGLCGDVSAWGPPGPNLFPAFDILFMSNYSSEVAGVNRVRWPRNCDSFRGLEDLEQINSNHRLVSRPLLFTLTRR